VLGFALLLSLGTGVLFGLIPALQVTRSEPLGELREGGRGSEGGLTRLRPLFVAGQFALAMVLLVGAGLLVRSFLNLQRVDPGFEPEGVLIAQLRLPLARYPDGNSVRGFNGELLARLETLPGVERAGTISTFLSGRLPNSSSVALEGRQLPDAERRIPVTYDAVSDGLLDAVGMELLAGRGFTRADGPDDPPVVMVNETFVRRFYPGEDAVGQRFTFGNPDGEDPGWMTIVGVVADARRSGLDQEIRPSAFIPLSQYTDSGWNVVLRTAGDPVELAGALRESVRALDPDLPVSRIRTLEQAVAEGLGARRFLTLLLAAFATVGTLLAAIGVYGVMAFLVGRRTREIGIRVALGAGRGTILGSVVREALLQAGVGLAIGLGAALLLGRVVQSQLFGLGAADPLTLGAVGALLLAVATVAAALPARRATRVAPSVALRVE
jgi:putative ABC transport system permease protein